MRVPLCSVILIHYVTKVVIDDVILTKKRVAVCRTRTSSSFGLTYYLIHGTRSIGYRTIIIYTVFIAYETSQHKKYNGTRITYTLS